jgi:bifunctional ADP-heptose synthase (sugar kinase/adenylyltransferase)
VGRNIADALGKLGTRPFLISAIGNDHHGDYLINNTLKHIVSTNVCDKKSTFSFVRDIVDHEQQFPVRIAVRWGYEPGSHMGLADVPGVHKVFDTL